MSQRVSGYERIERDQYESPVWCGTVLADHFLRGRDVGMIWDCCDGPSHRLAALRKAGFTLVTSFDDVLQRRKVPNANVRTIVSNPPFGRAGKPAYRICWHALNLAPCVAMLLRNDFDSGKGRMPLFGDNPHFAGKLVLVDRPVWITPAVASPSDNFSWFLWSRGHCGPPTVQYARRPT